MGKNDFNNLPITSATMHIRAEVSVLKTLPIYYHMIGGDLSITHGKKIFMFLILLLRLLA
jgi:hypothetical protein